MKVDCTYLSCAETKTPMCGSNEDEMGLLGRVAPAGWVAFKSSCIYAELEKVQYEPDRNTY